MTPMAQPHPSDRLLVVIPARDEAPLLEGTLRHVHASVRPGDAVIVIDDGSTDGTAEVAEGCGAGVARRRSGEGGGVGKGAALKWWVEAAGEAMDAFLGLVVIDADTRVDPRFLDAMRDRLRSGTRAIQGFVVPTGMGGSAFSALAGYSEWLEQAVDDRIRGALGWPVRLRGTGMAFRLSVFRAAVQDLRSSVEDVEMSLRLAEMGIRVVPAPEACVFDPKPADARSGARQRARWLRGQWRVWNVHRAQIGRLLRRGPWAWSLVGSMLLKPKSLLLVMKVGVLALALAARPVWPALGTLTAVAVAFGLVLDLAYYGIGLLVIARPGPLLGRLILAPTYPMLWLCSAAIALRCPETWWRARGSSHSRPYS